MIILYIGPNTDGTTCKMRGEVLRNILVETYEQVNFFVIDTHIPFFQTNRVWRSVGSRYKWGLLIKNINKYILKQTCQYKQNLRHNTYTKIPKFDLIWIDKAVFITPNTTLLLKKQTHLLVHYTPDPSFTFHRSRHFIKSLKYYDFAITTKSYELSHLRKFLSRNRIILATQGFEKRLHRPVVKPEDKKTELLFIGHCENERKIYLQKILNSGIPITLAGIKWGKFVSKNKSNELLTWLGEGLYGQDYAITLSSYWFAWGALSKWVPELHTTRTFEIPACGTALITERNKETQTFFNDDEVVFYNTDEHMIARIKYYMSHLNDLEKLIKKGTERVNKDGRYYEKIISRILIKMGIISGV